MGHGPPTPSRNPFEAEDTANDLIAELAVGAGIVGDPRRMRIMIDFGKSNSTRQRGCSNGIPRRGRVGGQVWRRGLIEERNVVPTITRSVGRKPRRGKRGKQLLLESFATKGSFRLLKAS
jgi:hypothetical protein